MNHSDDTEKSAVLFCCGDNIKSVITLKGTEGGKSTWKLEHGLYADICFEEEMCE